MTTKPPNSTLSQRQQLVPEPKIVPSPKLGPSVRKRPEAKGPVDPSTLTLPPMQGEAEEVAPMRSSPGIRRGLQKPATLSAPSTMAEARAAVAASAAKRDPNYQPPSTEVAAGPPKLSTAARPAADGGRAVVQLKASDVPHGYTRQSLPSRGVPYFGPSGWREAYVRPLRFGDLARLSSAAKESDFSAMLDVLNNCIHQDIRELTQSDFRFLLYWWRINSFLR
jgi:hypothetical protein